MNPPETNTLAAAHKDPLLAAESRTLQKGRRVRWLHDEEVTDARPQVAGSAFEDGYDMGHQHGRREAAAEERRAFADVVQMLQDDLRRAYSLIGSDTT